MDDKEFIGQTFKQKCGLNLFVINRTEFKQSGRNPLYLCKFEDGEEVLCRKDHVLRGTIQNKNFTNDYENEFIGKEWKQNSGIIVVPIRKTDKQISGVYAYEGYIKGYEDKGYITFLKSYAQRGNISNPFLVWKNKETFENYLNNISFEPTIINIAKDLNLSVSMIGQIIYKYELFDKIKYNNIISNEESILKNYIEDIYKGKVDRYILSNSKEIDIYLPDLKIGFEFNGNYWHSELHKDKDYHRNKSLLAQKEGIRLIHIWEWEWLVENSKIRKFIKNLICSKEIIYARKCNIQRINDVEYKQFLEENHIQGFRGAKIKLGLYYEGKLVQIMSFGSPRFTDKFDWELIRESSKLGYIIVGGKERLWKEFIRLENPKNCISYCDFSKFDGHSYENLGFKKVNLNKDFVWWEEGSNLVFWRTPAKHQQLKNRCLRIWKAGQLVYEWQNF